MKWGESYRKTRKSYDEPGQPHELTFSCHHGRPFLSKDRTRQYLAEAISRAKPKYGIDLWAYVFMPEHVHLLVWPGEGECPISNFLKAIKQSVARRALLYLRKHNPAGLRWLATGWKHSPYTFWQEGGGYDRNVTMSKTLSKMVEYIHNNPVRRGLVQLPEDWPWSSAREWAGLGAGPVPIDAESFPGG